MKDRVPLYPGRVRLTPVSGQENTYDMVRADEPTQEGTPLNKATLLKDATAEKFRLNPQTATVDDVLNLVLPSRIIVNAPTGSTVTCTKGSTVLTTSEVSGTWTFCVPDYGTWTVTATNGTKTVTRDVLVDVITEYEITMDYRFYLYNEGDECEGVTGGWTIDGYVYTGETYGVRAGVKNADSFYLSGLPTSTAFGTAHKVDLSAYNTLYATFHYDQTYKENPWVSALIGEKDLVGRNRYPNQCFGNGVDADITASADISGLSGNHYVAAACTTSEGGGYVYKIWLE